MNPNLNHISHASNLPSIHSANLDLLCIKPFMVHRVHPTPTTLPIVTVPALATLGHAAAKHVLEQNVYSTAPSASCPKPTNNGNQTSLISANTTVPTGLPIPILLDFLHAANGLNKPSPSIHVPRMPLADTCMYFYNAVPNVRKRTIQHPPLHSTSSLSDLVPGYTHYSSLSPRHRSGRPHTTGT